MRFRYAKSLARAQRTDEAIEQYEQVLRLDPGIEDAHLALAGILTAAGRPEEALEHALAAYAIPPNKAPELFRLGKAYRALGRFTEALQAFRESSAAAPDIPDPCAAFAEAVLAKGDATPEERREALACARKANEIAGAAHPELAKLLAKIEELAARAAAVPDVPERPDGN